MCTDVLASEHLFLQYDLIAYKIMRWDEVDSLTSMYPPTGRLPQRADMQAGQNFFYKYGELSKSPFSSTEGMYCFASLAHALEKQKSMHGSRWMFKVIEVHIPKDTRIRLGFQYSGDRSAIPLIHTEQLIPLREIKE